MIQILDGLAQIVDSVANHYKLTKFIGFGIGAGANVLLRYAVSYLTYYRKQLHIFV
jgi:hypothetical protein